MPVDDRDRVVLLEQEQRLLEPHAAGAPAPGGPRFGLERLEQQVAGGPRLPGGAWIASGRGVGPGGRDQIASQLEALTARGQTLVELEERDRGPPLRAGGDQQRVRAPGVSTGGGAGSGAAQRVREQPLAPRGRFEIGEDILSQVHIRPEDSTRPGGA